jgi:probable phosphoglycerate mutase
VIGEVHGVELILVRHALPIRVDAAQGAADPPLAALGRDQAQAVADWLPDERVDAVVQSPLRRAIETAAPIARRYGVVPVILDGLAECDATSSNYIPYEEIMAQRDYRWDALRRGELFDPSIDVAAFRKTAVAEMENVIAGHPGGTVIAVCHGAVMNAYVGYILGIERLMWFYPQYAGVTRVAASRWGDRSVLSLNETPPTYRRTGVAAIVARPG